MGQTKFCLPPAQVQARAPELTLKWIANRDSVSHDITLQHTQESRFDLRVSDHLRVRVQLAGGVLAHGSVVHIHVRLQFVCASDCCFVACTETSSRRSKQQAALLTKSDFCVWFSALLPPKRSPNVKIRHYHRKARPILPPCTTRRALGGYILVF